MSRRRVFMPDIAYGEEHRRALPELYGRIGHRLDLADRDWTEFCHWCRAPIGIFEEVQDVGQDLNDKATTITRKLARRAGLPAFLFGWRVERPRHIQAQIDDLGRQLFALQTSMPIVGFKAKQLWPNPSPLLELTPRQWWLQLLILHRSHHETCSAAHRQESAVNGDGLAEALNGSRLWTPDDQLTLHKESNAR